jgi:hypothetical protein
MAAAREGLQPCMPGKAANSECPVLKNPVLTMQIRVADSQSRTPGWVSVNAFAHVQLREGACARVPVVCPLVDTLGAAREE